MNLELASIEPMYVLATIAGIAIPLFSLWAGRRLLDYKEKREKKRRPADYSRSIRIPCASVSDDLMPLIDKLRDEQHIDFANSEMWVFGSDGRYVAKSKGRNCCDRLAHWASQGLTIKYVLIEADHEVRKGPRDLSLKAGGKLDVLILRASHERVDTAILDELETCHPTLFFGAGGRNAAWIEGLHRRDSQYALDVEFVSPNAMHGPEIERFDAYKAKVAHLMAHSEPLVPATAAHAA